VLLLSFEEDEEVTFDPVVKESKDGVVAFTIVEEEKEEEEEGGEPTKRLILSFLFAAAASIHARMPLTSVKLLIMFCVLLLV
jgi:hypothetical protein